MQGPARALHSAPLSSANTCSAAAHRRVTTGQLKGRQIRRPPRLGGEGMRTTGGRALRRAPHLPAIGGAPRGDNRRAGPTIGTVERRASQAIGTVEVGGGGERRANGRASESTPGVRFRDAGQTGALPKALGAQGLGPPVNPTASHLLPAARRGARLLRSCRRFQEGQLLQHRRLRQVLGFQGSKVLGNPGDQCFAN